MHTYTIYVYVCVKFYVKKKWILRFGEISHIRVEHIRDKTFGKIDRYVCAYMKIDRIRIGIVARFGREMGFPLLRRVFDQSQSPSGRRRAVENRGEPGRAFDPTTKTSTWSKYETTLSSRWTAARWVSPRCHSTADSCRAVPGGCWKRICDHLLFHLAVSTPLPPPPFTYSVSGFVFFRLPYILGRKYHELLYIPRKGLLFIFGT